MSPATATPPLLLSPEDRLRLLPTAWVTVTEKGIRINNRTYDSRALNPYRGKLSGWPGKGQRWPVRHHPHQPERVWLQTEPAGGWKEATFVYQRLIGDAWTQQVWDLATAHHLDMGGSTHNEAAIAREVRALLQRAGHGPSRASSRSEPAPAADRGMTVGVEPAQSPYQGIPAPDFHTISALPSMDVSLSRLCSGPLPPLQPVATLPHDAT